MRYNEEIVAVVFVIIDFIKQMNLRAIMPLSLAYGFSMISTGRSKVGSSLSAKGRDWSVMAAAFIKNFGYYSIILVSTRLSAYAKFSAD